MGPNLLSLTLILDIGREFMISFEVLRLKSHEPEQSCSQGQRAVSITEKPYTLRMERLCCRAGSPVIFTDCREKPFGNYRNLINPCFAVHLSCEVPLHTPIDIFGYTAIPYRARTGFSLCTFPHTRKSCFHDRECC